MASALQRTRLLPLLLLILAMVHPTRGFFLPATQQQKPTARKSDTGPEVSRPNPSPPPLQMAGSPNKSDDNESTSESFNEIIGINRGLYLLALAVAANIWLFSIPPEFRRAKICSEQQVIDYPNSNCMTSGMWVGGIKDYYSNGGGIKFDFTVEKSSTPKWMGGEQPYQQ